MKKNVKKVLLMLCILLGGGTFIFSGVKLTGIYRERSAGTKSYTAMAEKFVTPARKLPQATQAHRTEAVDEQIEETAPICVDFAALREENAEIVGWLYCEGTEINYPVLHAENNDKYLRALPDGSYNYFGSLFMDYRNREDLTDENTLIYGHNMESSNQMFGGLSAFLEQAYADSHPHLYYLTPHGDYRVDVFAAYETTDSSEAYQRIFGSEEEYRSFLTLLEERSAIDMEIRPVTENRILTLSTCTNRSSNGRYVLHGVLRPLFDAEKNTGNGR